MSENQNRRPIDYETYDAMTTEALEQILRDHAEAPIGQESDGEVLLYVMEVLTQRKQTCVDPEKTVQNAWESFVEHYMPREEKTPVRQPKLHRPWMRRFAATAAVLVLVFAIAFTTVALTGGGIRSFIAKWKDGTFSFVGGEDVTIPAATGQPHPYTALQEAMFSSDEEAASLPVWVPEGFAYRETQILETPEQRCCIAIYTNADKTVVLSIRNYVDFDPEKNEVGNDLIEIYEASGIDYYIFSNNQQLRALWIEGSYECYISGDLTLEELKMMIDSIRKG